MFCRLITTLLLPLKIAYEKVVLHRSNRLYTLRPKVAHLHNPWLALPFGKHTTCQSREKLRRRSNYNVSTYEESCDEGCHRIADVVKSTLQESLVRYDIRPNAYHLDAINNLLLIEFVLIAFVHLTLWKVWRTRYDCDIRPSFHPLLAMLISS